jgi:hypothetical protein
MEQSFNIGLLGQSALSRDLLRRFIAWALMLPQLACKKERLVF